MTLGGNRKPVADGVLNGVVVVHLIGQLVASAGQGVGSGDDGVGSGRATQNGGEFSHLGLGHGPSNHTNGLTHKAEP